MLLAGRSSQRLVYTLLLCLGCCTARAGQGPRDAAILRIQSFIESGNLEAARAQLHQAMQAYPRDGGLENLLGVVDMQQGQTAQAVAQFRLAVQHSPRLTGALLNLARVSMQAATPATAQDVVAQRSAAAEAAGLYERALRVEPSNAEAAYGAATALLWTGDFERSLAAIQVIGPAQAATPQVQAILCADALNLHRTSEAERAASAMTHSPALAEQDVLLTLPAMRTAHRADLLETLLLAAQSHHPLSLLGLRTLGLAQEAEGNYAEARATFERLYKEQPNETMPLLDLARVALAASDAPGALGYIAHARALAPADAQIDYEYAYICLQMHLLREARLALAAAVSLAPGNADYALAMGRISDGADAVPYLHAELKLRPGDPRGVLALGIAYFQNNDVAHAQPLLEQAATNVTTASAANLYLARILIQQRQDSAALDKLNAANCAQRGQPEVLAQMGEAYLQERRYDDAARWSAQALALDSDNYTANYCLLRVYTQTNDPRRIAQAARFQALRTQNEAQYRDAMRGLEARPVPEAVVSTHP